MNQNLYPGDSAVVGNGMRHVTVEADGTSAAFKDGYDDYHDGVRREENPHLDTGWCSDAEDWEDGWVRGKSETVAEHQPIGVVR